MVVDPLYAVPSIPFGHLNQAWKNFTAELGAEDRLWFLLQSWKSSFNGDELKKGDVIVTNGLIGRYFLTMDKRI